jgi:predicted nucleotidyltransferase
MEGNRQVMEGEGFGHGSPKPLVTQPALEAFTQRLVERFAPEQVILFGSMARGEARWDSDADLLVVMPFEGRSLDTVKAMHSACEADFPLDLHLRRPEEIEPRYRWGDPFIREALNHGKLLHSKLSHRNLLPGKANHGRLAVASEREIQVTPVRNPVVTEWIERAERHWRMAEQFADLHVSYQSGMFMAQLCLETYLRAALIAQGVESRKCRDLQMLSDRLRYPIPGWTPDPETLNSLTQAAVAYLDPCAGHPEPSHNGAWAIAHAGPLRDCLRGWFENLKVVG